MNKHLVVDTSNLLYRTFYAYKDESEEDLGGMAHHMALTTLNKYFKQYKPQKVVLCFDRKNGWRKKYTESEECVSKKIYKANRRLKQTPAEKAKFKAFLEHIADFENIIQEHSSILCLGVDGCEGDDMIAGYVQVNESDDNEFIIVSGDMDLLQLLKYKNTTLIDPATGKQRTLEEYGYDPEYFMFHKCIRGDPGDNVQSAYPRIRTTRIKKAYYDDQFEYTKIMEHTWKLAGREYVTKKLYKENRLLMDLEQQPPDIQHKIILHILQAQENPGKFSYFHFIKFLGQNKLDKIKKRAEDFVPLLSL